MIKVMIERHIASELLSQYQQIAASTLQTAMRSNGFISGESLQDASDPSHRYVFATYRTVQDWQLWYHSDARKAQVNALRPLLVGEEKITILEHI